MFISTTQNFNKMKQHSKKQERISKSTDIMLKCRCFYITLLNEDHINSQISANINSPIDPAAESDKKYSHALVGISSFSINS